MSAFDMIKDSILSVPKDITTGIKALTTRDSSQDSSAAGDQATSSRVAPVVFQSTQHSKLIDHDAGSELLTKFQNSWSEMHKTSEENAKHAKAVDGQIGELFLYLERQREAVGLFLQEICTLPQLLHDVNKAIEQIQSLEGEFEVVESELVVLEDTCERQELLRNKRHHEYQLGAFRQRRSVELEQAKVRMAKDHADKVQRYEAHLQRGLRDKQQAFEATFKEEIQHYKKYGKPSKHFVSPEPSPSKELDLSQFVPDTDPNTDAILDEFLQVEVVDTIAGQESTTVKSEMDETEEESKSVITQIVEDIPQVAADIPQVAAAISSDQKTPVEIQNSCDTEYNKSDHRENIEPFEIEQHHQETESNHEISRTDKNCNDSTDKKDTMHLP